MGDEEKARGKISKQFQSKRADSNNKAKGAALV